VRKVVPEERTSVIPYWVPCMPPFCSQEGRLATPAHLLYVGRLERYKGLYLLLEALRKIPNVRLTVVGDGSYRPELGAPCTGNKRSFSEGYQSHPTKYFSERTSFVMPSLGPEGFRDSDNGSDGAQLALPHQYSMFIERSQLPERQQCSFAAETRRNLRRKLRIMIAESSLRSAFLSGRIP